MRRRYRPGPRRRSCGPGPRSGSRGARRGGPARPLVLRALVDRQVDPVTEPVGSLVRQRLLQIPQHHADQEVLLARPGPQTPGGRPGEPGVRGGGKDAYLLDARCVGAESLPDAVAERLLVLVLVYRD